MMDAPLKQWPLPSPTTTSDVDRSHQSATNDSPDLLHYQPTIAEVFQAAYARGDLDTLPQCIANMTYLPLDDAGKKARNRILHSLTMCCKLLGVDLSAAHAQFAATPPSRCTRCSAIFHQAANGPQACIIEHSPPLVSNDVQVLGYVDDAFQTRYYTCCGICTVGPPSEPLLSSSCYTGPHTTSVESNLNAPEASSESQVEIMPEYGRTIQAPSGIAIPVNPETSVLEPLPGVPVPVQDGIVASIPGTSTPTASNPLPPLAGEGLGPERAGVYPGFAAPPLSVHHVQVQVQYDRRHAPPPRDGSLHNVPSMV